MLKESSHPSSRVGSGAPSGAQRILELHNSPTYFLGEDFLELLGRNGGDRRSVILPAPASWDRLANDLKHPRHFALEYLYIMPLPWHGG
jgi:hypothetical protein